MSKPSKARQAELIDIATEHLSDREWFEYHDWDGLIECDETLTDAELDWMRENLTVTVSVTREPK